LQGFSTGNRGLVPILSMQNEAMRAGSSGKGQGQVNISKSWLQLPCGGGLMIEPEGSWGWMGEWVGPYSCQSKRVRKLSM
jgi:hypothetical protein